MKRNEMQTKTNLKRNQNEMKRTDNELTTNLKRDEAKRKAFPLALTGDDARALSVPVQRPGDGKSLSASGV